MIHIYPLNDIEEHIIDCTVCWCVPMITEEYGQLIITHNAFDGRTNNENNKQQKIEENYG